MEIIAILVCWTSTACAVGNRYGADVGFATFMLLWWVNAWLNAFRDAHASGAR